MNMHDALTSLFYGVAALAAGLTFWLIADGLKRLGFRQQPSHKVTDAQLHSLIDSYRNRRP